MTRVAALVLAPNPAAGPEDQGARDDNIDGTAVIHSHWLTASHRRVAIGEPAALDDSMPTALPRSGELTIDRARDRQPRE